MEERFITQMSEIINNLDESQLKVEKHAYDVINSSAQIALLNFPSNYTYIMSNTDMVSAGHLASKLQVDGKIDFLENNGFRKKEILPVSLNILPDQVLKISLEAIGIGCLKLEALPFKIEFSGNKLDDSSSGGDNAIAFDFNGKEIVLTESVMMKITLFIGAPIIGLLVAIMLFAPNFVKEEKDKLATINGEIKTIETQINNLTTETSAQGDFIVNLEVEKVIKANRDKLITYSALGQAIPKELWLTYLSIDNSNKIDIQGIAEDVENVYLFYRNLKSTMINSNLRLIKLENLSGNTEDIVVAPGSVLYEFQISNGSGTTTAPVSTPEPAEKK